MQAGNKVALWFVYPTFLACAFRFSFKCMTFFTDGDPASQILQHYSDRISQVSLSDSCIQLLYTKGLINEETQRKIERCGGSLSDSLRELMITVSEDHSKLRSLGDILLKLEETKSVAQEMINDYGKNKSSGIIIVTIIFSRRISST